MVLNWGDSVLGSPVDGGSEVGLVKEWGLGGSGDGFVTVKFLHLGEGGIGEEVVSNGVGVVGIGVEGLDLVVSGDELFFSEHEFGNSSVGFTVFGNVGHEFVVFGGEFIISEELDTGWCFVHEGGSGNGGGGSKSEDGGFSVHCEVVLKINYKRK